MERTDLLSREAIRDLLGRYTWAGDQGRAAELAALFTTDGVLDVGDHGGRWEGRERIERELTAVTERVAASSSTPGPVRHHVSSVLIDLDTHAQATVRSYSLVLTDAGVDHWGRYRDQVVETAPGGSWQFQERVVRVDGHAPGSRMVTTESR
jgi:uncharacterized protein (TIGR02246 family)